MSIAALNWVMQQTWPTTSQFAVMMMLANYADEVGSCYPGQEHICAVTRVGETTLRGILKDLEVAGKLRRERGAADGRRNRLTRYFLLMENDSSARRPQREPAAAAGASEPAAVAGSPAPSTGNGGAENRQPAPRVPAVAAANTKGESKTESEERERARDARFEGLLARHPNSAHDDRWLAEDAWRVLSTEDRTAAVDRFGDWLAEAKGRTKLPALAKYLGQRLWTLLPAPVKPAAEVAAETRVAPFTRAWWFVWHRRLGESPEAARRMASLATGPGIGVRLMDDEKAAIERGDDARLVRLAINGEDGRWTPEIDAWASWAYRAHRLRLPVPDQAPFLFVPTHHPPGTAEADAEARDREDERAEEQQS